MKYMALVCVLVIGLVPAAFFQPVSAESSNLMINELQTGGYDEFLHEDGTMEFIELYNNSPEQLDVTGYMLQYFSATREDVFDINATPTRQLGTLEGEVAGRGHILFSYEDFIATPDIIFGQDSTASSGLLARSGGHIRIINEDGVVDVVGWGTAKSPETKAIPELSPGESYERVNAEVSNVDSDNNFADFVRLEQPTPTGGSLIEPEPEVEGEPAPETMSCDGLIISEIMPNPEGNDSGKEFIELHNPTTSEILLDTCILKISSSTSHYDFVSGTVLKAGEYRAFYDQITELTLANAAGGTVVIIGTNTEYIVTYPPNMEANETWALINNEWQTTNQPTPNSLNLIRQVEPDVRIDVEELASCGMGRYRHPETNRCRNIVATATLATCQEGYVRNPQTNRCRSIITLANGLIPCREGQERNPETNRCRNVSSSASTECQAGYERNPETNRCRKIQAVLAASPSVGSLDSQSTGRINHAFLVLMSVAVVFYGVYEYRRDLSNLLARFRDKRQAKAVASK